jgi:putative nucleotidyltransferase with HDIG domain
MKTEDIIEQIALMYQRAAGLKYGEEITQLEHALQCYDLAVQDQSEPYLAVAAFLHDIGHLSDPEYAGDFGLADHDDLGAVMLETWGFPKAVTEPIRCHVMAKRYLVAMNPEYVWSLSEASMHTLHEQGGAFSAQECEEFQKCSYFDDAIRLRLWDDHGKVVHEMRMQVPSIVLELVWQVLRESAQNLEKK